MLARGPPAAAAAAAAAPPHQRCCVEHYPPCSSGTGTIGAIRVAVGPGPRSAQPLRRLLRALPPHPPSTPSHTLALLPLTDGRTHICTDDKRNKQTTRNIRNGRLDSIFFPVCLRIYKWVHTSAIQTFLLLHRFIRFTSEY
eukprot:gene958-555_t